MILRMLLCVVLLSMVPWCRAAVPDSNGVFLNDLAHMVPESEAVMLRERLEALDARHGVELVVVTVDTYDREFREVDEFAEAVFGDWGVGVLAQKYGVLLVVTRGAEVAIVTGEYFPDYVNEELQNIIDQVIVLPALRREPAVGVVAGVDQIIAVLDQKHQWLGWYHWHILISALFLLSLPLALKLNKHKYLPWYLLLPAMPGFILIGIFQYLNGAGAFDDDTLSGIGVAIDSDFGGFDGGGDGGD